MSEISALQAASANLVIARTEPTGTSGADAAAKTSSVTPASPSVSTATAVVNVGHAALVATLKAKEGTSSSTSSSPPIITPGDNPTALEPLSYANGSSEQYVQAYFSRSVDQLNSIIDTNQSLTDQQVSQAFYSGQGLQQGYKENYTIKTLQKDLSMAADATTDLDKKAALQTEVDQISTAFANHTLVIQNAANVSGLDFSNSSRYIGQGDQAPAGLTANDSMSLANRNFLEQNPDGKQHYFAAVDGSFSGVYLTW